MMTPPPDPQKLALLEAILAHVPFDGWSQAAFRAATAELDLTPAQAEMACPRGAVDLAVLYHKEGDRKMAEAAGAEDMTALRYSEKVARMIRLRLDAVSDKEAARRGTTLFALPHMAPDGAKLIWGTSDAIWTALGDSSRDVNWYTKRATLSGVYGSVVLYWLGDDSLDSQATDAFLARRIDDVMRFEKVKAQINDNAMLKPVTGLLDRLTSRIRAPLRPPRMDVPGMWGDPD